MQDREIIRLYWNRDERAIAETDTAYGAYCRSIARTITGSALDAEECVNDTYLHVWNVIPPQCPAKLSAFLGRITRNLSLDRVRRNCAQKRGGGEYAQITDELASCLPSADDTARDVENAELENAVNAYLRTLRERDRALFLLRYFYMKPIAACAIECGISENNAKVMLHRLRKKLKAHLEKEGYV